MEVKPHICPEIKCHGASEGLATFCSNGKIQEHWSNTSIKLKYNLIKKDQNLDIKINFNIEMSYDFINILHFMNIRTKVYCPVFEIIKCFKFKIFAHFPREKQDGCCIQSKCNYIYGEKRDLFLLGNMWNFTFLVTINHFATLD